MYGIRGGHTEFAGEGRLCAHKRYALDERDAMIDRDGYNCWRCGCYLPGQRGARAHRIARTKVNLNEYGPYVLDHRLNLKHSCEKCNSYAMHFDSMEEREAMLATIIADLTARGFPIDGASYKDRQRISREQLAAEKVHCKEAKKTEQEYKRIIQARDAAKKRKEYKQQYKKKNRNEINRKERERYHRGKVVAKSYTWFEDADDAAVYRTTYARLHGYLQSLRKKYNIPTSEVTSVCTARELRKVEDRRADVEKLRKRAIKT